jgi:hypothetical protein
MKTDPDPQSYQFYLSIKNDVKELSNILVGSVGFANLGKPPDWFT